MELKDPAMTYRAPYPYVPIITPAKQLYRLNSVGSNEEYTSSKLSNGREAPPQPMFRRSRSTPRYGKSSTERKIFRSFDDNTGPLHISENGGKISENEIIPMLELERRMSRWVIGSRRLSNRSTKEDERPDEYFHSADRKRPISNPTIPTSWSLPRETERSWNKSPRPIAELVGTYERSHPPRFERQRSFVKSVTGSSRYPVPEMAESYLQSNVPKK